MMHKCPPVNAILAKNETKKGHNQVNIVQKCVFVERTFGENVY